MAIQFSRLSCLVLMIILAISHLSSCSEIMPTEKSSSISRKIQQGPITTAPVSGGSSHDVPMVGPKPITNPGSPVGFPEGPKPITNPGSPVGFPEGPKPITNPGSPVGFPHSPKPITYPCSKVSKITAGSPGSPVGFPDGPKPITNPGSPVGFPQSPKPITYPCSAVSKITAGGAVTFFAIGSHLIIYFINTLLK